MDPGVKNLFTLAISVLTLSGRYASSIPQLINSTRDRLSALARAHALTLSHGSSHTVRRKTGNAAFFPRGDFRASPRRGRRSPIFRSLVAIWRFRGRRSSSLALLLHEFATNSVKYRGAFLDCRANRRWLARTERETSSLPGPSAEVLGSLHRLAMKGSAIFWFAPPRRAQLGGDISREWKPEGLLIRLSCREIA